MKRSRASGLTVETQRDFGLGGTDLRLLATGPTVEKTPKTLSLKKYHWYTTSAFSPEVLTTFFFTVVPPGKLWIDLCR